jgi:hypothetical protein
LLKVQGNYNWKRKDFVNLLLILQNSSPEYVRLETINSSEVSMAEVGPEGPSWNMLDPARFPLLRTLLLGSFKPEGDMRQFLEGLPRLEQFAISHDAEFSSPQYWQLPEVLATVPNLPEKAWAVLDRRVLIGGTWVKFARRFQFLCLQGTPDAVDRAMEEDGIADIDHRLKHWPYTLTALHFAIGGNNIAVVRHLIENRKADVTLRCSLNANRPDMDALELAAALHLPEIFSVVLEHYPSERKTPGLLYRLFDCCNDLTASGRGVLWYRVEDAIANRTYHTDLARRDRIFQLLLALVAENVDFGLSDISCDRTGRNLLFTGKSPASFQEFIDAGLSILEKDAYGDDISTVFMDYFHEARYLAPHLETLAPLARLYDDFGYPKPERDSKSMKAAVKVIGVDNSVLPSSTKNLLLSHIVTNASKEDLKASSTIMDRLFNRVQDLGSLKSVLDLQLPLGKPIFWGVSYLWHGICEFQESFIGSMSGSWNFVLMKISVLLESKSLKRNPMVEKELFKGVTLQKLIIACLKPKTVDVEKRRSLLRLVDLVVDELLFCQLWPEFSRACKALPTRPQDIPYDLKPISSRILQIYLDRVSSSEEMEIDGETMANLFQEPQF